MKKYGHYRQQNMAYLKAEFPRWYTFHMAVAGFPRRAKITLYLMQRKARLPKPFWLRLLIGLDQFANALFSPLLNQLIPFGASRFGFIDETLSSVFAKNAEQVTWCRWMCRALHVLDQGHCTESLESDEGDKEK